VAPVRRLGAGHRHGQATGDPAAGDAASRAAGLFLAHRLLRSLAAGQVIHRAWLAPHYPPYWHYDILQALLVLSRMGRADDPRASDARDELQRRRLPDGRWQAEYRTSTFLRASAQAAAVGQRGRRSTGAKEVPPECRGPGGTICQAWQGHCDRCLNAATVGACQVALSFWRCLRR